MRFSIHSRPFGAAFALSSLLIAGVNAQTTVGQANGANCYPFSCFASDGGSVYQQVYSASAFSGISSFDSITFYANTDFDLGLMDDATYTIRFSTTAQAVNNLDLDPNNNVGGDEAIFGSFAVSGNIPTTLTFTGNPFTYNPAKGNLLMTVTVDSLNVANVYTSAFRANDSGADTSRLYINADGANVDSTGLMTTFNTVNAIPEPSAAAFGILAAGSVLGLVARRRKA